MKPLILAILILLFFVTSIFAEANLIPQEIEWDGHVYTYDPYWKEYESCKYGNFDGDGKNEIIVSFMGQIEDTVIDRPFYLIYDVINGERKLIKTIIGNMYLGEVRIIDLEKDGQKEIAIFSSGGAHYTNLYIYRYKDGSYECIFENGSACGVEFMEKAPIPLIKLGRANWEKEGWCYADEPLWEIHTWDGEKFAYREEVSTSRQLSEKEELQRYLDKVRSLTEKDEKQIKIRKEVAEFSRQHKDFEQYRPYMHEISLRPENENLSLQELYDKAKEENKAAIEKSFNDILNAEYYFNGYKTTYKEWKPIISRLKEYKIGGNNTGLFDSFLFFEAYTKELEKEYNTNIDMDDIPLSRVNEYFAKRAEKDGYDILVTTLIEDFYIERGLLPSKSDKSKIQED